MTHCILDARDVTSVKQMQEEYNKRVLGNHLCFDLIWCSQEFIDEIQDYCFRTQGWRPDPPRFKGIVMNVPLVTTPELQAKG